MEQGIIYVFTNLTNGKKYVGQSAQPAEQRYRQHLSDARGGRQRSLAMAIRKYGESKFTFEVICSAPLTELNSLEKHFIKHYSSDKRAFGYNRTSGGNGCAANEEVRLKMSLAKKGRPLTEEHRAKLRKVRTPEQIQAKIDARTARREAARVKRVERMTGERNPFFGKSHSPEVLQKMSLAATGRPSWNKGISPSQETRAKIADTLKGQTPWNLGVAATDEHKQRLSESHKGKKQSVELVVKRTEKIRGGKRTPEQRRNISEACRGRVNSDEHKQACRDAVKALWANPEYREKMLRSRREKATLRKEA